MSEALKLMEKAALRNRLAHLLLFHGGSSEERRNFAMHLAQILNCRNEELRPCGHCTSCHKIATENHPDVLRIEPQKSSLGIERILEWQELVYRTRYEGKYKVFLLEKADTLTLPAGNALLKIVEEPPADTVIVLSADNAEGILPTIRSRAQNIYFCPPTDRAWMKNHEGVEEEKLKAVFRLSGNDPELADGILEMGQEKIEDWLSRFWQAVGEKDFLKLFPLFPMEKAEAMVLVQVIAEQVQQEVIDNKTDPGAFLATGRGIEALRDQVSPRLVIEVLALELFDLRRV